MDIAKESSRRWREENKDYLSVYRKSYYRKTRKQRLEYIKRYREENKEELRKKRIEYYYENHEKMLESRRRYCENNSDKVKETNKAYNRKNKDKKRKYMKEYTRENPHIIRAIHQQRRARLKQLPYTLTHEEWKSIKNYFGNSCAYCGMSEKEHQSKWNEQLHQDHFIAVSNNGGYTADNIIPACKSCNSSKSDRHFDEWYPSHESFDEERNLKISEYFRHFEESELALAE